MKNTNKRVFATQLLNSRMTPMLRNWLEIEPIIEDGAVEVLYGRKTAVQSLKYIENKIKGSSNY